MRVALKIRKKRPSTRCLVNNPGILHQQSDITDVVACWPLTSRLYTVSGPAQGDDARHAGGTAVGESSCFSDFQLAGFDEFVAVFAPEGMVVGSADGSGFALGVQVDHVGGGVLEGAGDEGAVAWFDVRGRDPNGEHPGRDRRLPVRAGPVQ